MDIVDIYKDCGDFYKAVELSGLSLKVAHIKLMKAGILKIQDKIKYGSKATALGGKAEELFQKLVPEAIDANKYWQKNNPVFDFMYRGLTIDVKFSSCVDIGVRKTIKRWKSRVSGIQKLTVAFLEAEPGAELTNYYILVIPNSFLHQKKTLDLYVGSPYFKDFLTSPEELKNI